MFMSLINFLYVNNHFNLLHYRCRVLEAQLLVAKNELSAKLKIIEVQRANIEDLKKEIECCRLR